MQLDLGNKIRELRRQSGRTQEALAEAIGVTSQAVSRWESGGGYPDMEAIPSIANYFGITIDELFGYHNERTQKIEAIVQKIDAMNRENNGEDKNIDECIALAREALVEFPGNEKLMLSLASVLYNAGYVRYGEYHLSDGEGFDILDAERHRKYAEWREAIPLYEKALQAPLEADLRLRAKRELLQLYLNRGEHDRAMALAERAPSIYGSRELLKTHATDGKGRAVAYSEALIKTVRLAAELTVSLVIASRQNMTAAEKAEGLSSVVKLFDSICTDGNYGIHHAFVARVLTLRAHYLWLSEKSSEAFFALDEALLHSRCFHAWQESYTAPLVRLAEEGAIEAPRTTSAISLAGDFPWWCVPDSERVKREMKQDSRWSIWVEKLG